MAETFWRGKKSVRSRQKTSAQLLRKRKFYVRALVFFTVFMLLAFNLASWLFLNRMNSYLEQELKTVESYCKFVGAKNRN